jgi:drug/metabolite transporter (DMT)-like permease
MTGSAPLPPVARLLSFGFSPGRRARGLPSAGGTRGSSSGSAALLVTGAIITGPSSTFIQAAHVSAPTAAAYRCLYAVPVLAVLAAVEFRRIGGRDFRERLLALMAGSFLGIDLVLWGHSIAGLGAGIATVVSNLQVFPVSLLGWLALREKPGRRLLMAAPVAVVGILLLGGAAGTEPTRSDPAVGIAYGLGSSCCFAVFLICLRMSQRGRQVVGPLLDATLGAAASATIAGLATRSLSVPPPASAEPYLILLAFWSQTAGWLLITYGLRGMRAARGALLFLINPLVALAVAAVALGERPSAAQVLGCVIVCVAVTAGSRAPDQAARSPDGG